MSDTVDRWLNWLYKWGDKPFARRWLWVALIALLVLWYVSGNVFMLVVFATYRISHMIVGEDGPFDVFTRLRTLVYKSKVEWIQRGFACVLCVSFWVSLLIAPLGAGVADWREFVLWWWGVAGAVMMVHKVVSR